MKKRGEKGSCLHLTLVQLPIFAQGLSAGSVAGYFKKSRKHEKEIKAHSA